MRHGFTLLELMLVVAITGIMAAIAIPSLVSARMTANEASAISCLRAVHSAQHIRHNTEGDYAPTLQVLLADGLIDDVLGTHVGARESEKHGYRFQMELKSYWLTNLGAGARFQGDYEWGLVAFPKYYKSSGTRQFWTDDSGVIRGTSRELIYADWKDSLACPLDPAVE